MPYLQPNWKSGSDKSLRIGPLDATNSVVQISNCSQKFKKSNSKNLDPTKVASSKELLKKKVGFLFKDFYFQVFFCFRLMRLVTVKRPIRSKAKQTF